MGMFNYIKIDKSVNFPEIEKYKGPNLHDLQYQTKSLDGGLSDYTIKNNQLFVDNVKMEWVEVKDHWLGGHMNEISRETVKDNHSGLVIFYECIDDYDENNDAWVEFSALFSKGNLIEDIELVKFELINNFAKKEADNKFKNKLKKEFELSRKWYYFIIRFYRFLIEKISNIIYKIGCLFSNISSNLIKLSIKIR